MRICCNENCGEIVSDDGCLDWKHPTGEKMCPHCNDITEEIDDNILRFSEVLDALNKEIDWHNEHKNLVSGTEHIAFVRGLVQAIYVIKNMAMVLMQDGGQGAKTK